MVSSDNDRHFFQPLQDENTKLNEELVSTKTDLSAQLAQCEEVHYIMYVYVYSVHTSAIDNTSVHSNVMFPMNLMLNVNYCMGTFNISGDFTL